MKFKIKHITHSLNSIRLISFFMIYVLIIIYALAGFKISDEKAFKILIYAEIVTVAVCVIFSFLSAFEHMFNAKIIIESNHVKIRKLFCHRNIPFDKIIDTECSHYYEREREVYKRHKYRRRRRFITFTETDDSRECNSFQLVFFLSSGKKIVLNDKIVRSKENRQMSIYNPDNVTPDDEIPLYKAYKCYTSARSIYFNNN